MGNFRLGFEPIREKTQMLNGNVSLSNSVEEMRQKLRRNILTANARHVIRRKTPA